MAEEAFSFALVEDILFGESCTAHTVAVGTREEVRHCTAGRSPAKTSKHVANLSVKVASVVLHVMGSREIHGGWGQ